MCRTIINDVLTAFKQYIPYAMSTGAIAMVAVCIILWMRSGKQNNAINSNYIKKIITLYIAYIYCFCVVFITFLSREPGSRDSLDLTLFSTFSKDFNNNIYPVENVILFIPFGIIFPLLLKWFRKLPYCLAGALTFSFLIETSQHITKRGYFQIDDIFTNIFGSLIGFIIYSILYRLLFILNRAKVHKK